MKKILIISTNVLKTKVLKELNKELWVNIDFVIFIKYFDHIKIELKLF